jgi:hypothetical protein
VGTGSGGIDPNVLLPDEKDDKSPETLETDEDPKAGD